MTATESRTGVLSTIGRAFGATFGNLGTVLPVVAVAGLISGMADTFVYDWITGALTERQKMEQSTLLKVLFSWEGNSLLIELLFGPIFAAVAVYVGRCYARGRDSSVYDAVNFALNRYSRVVGPHAGAQVSIRLGMLVVVPGVMFMLQYAFVDAVACLEEERWPMDRSKRLTRGRRKRIFIIFLPFIVLSQVVVFADMWALQKGGLMLSALHAFEFLLAFWLAVAFYLLYEERTTPVAPGTKVPEPVNPG